MASTRRTVPEQEPPEPEGPQGARDADEPAAQDVAGAPATGDVAPEPAAPEPAVPSDARPADGADGPPAPRSRATAGGPPPKDPRPARVATSLLGLLLLLAVAAVVAGAVLLALAPGPSPRAADRVSGEVIASDPAPCPAPGTGTDGATSAGTADQGCVRVVVRLSTGPDAGRSVPLVDEPGTGVARLAVGDGLVLARAPGGADDDALADRYTALDLQRTLPLTALLAVVVVLVLVLGAVRGAAVLVGLVAVGALLALGVVPALAGDVDPRLVALVAGPGALLALVLPAGGAARSTVTAALGGVLGVLAAVGVAVVAVPESRLRTPFVRSDEVVSALGAAAPQDLLLVGVSLAAAGVAAPLALAVARLAEVRRRVSTTASRGALLAAALRDGQERAASAAGVLLVVGAGVALPLLVLLHASGVTTADALVSRDVAVELVRALAATAGVLLVVPATALLSAAAAGPAVARAPVVPPGPDGDAAAARTSGPRRGRAGRAARESDAWLSQLRDEDGGAPPPEAAPARRRRGLRRRRRGGSVAAGPQG